MQSVLLRRVAAWVLAAAACALLAAAVGSAAIPASAGRASARAASTSGGLIAAVGAENEYANVISQIGGRYVRVSAIESNPNTDPHSFEASPSVAQEVSAAAVVVQNGLGYDSYMNSIEAASPELRSRKVIDVQTLLGLPDSTRRTATSGTRRARCRLWRRPGCRPRGDRPVARAPTSRPNATAFDKSLKPWYARGGGVSKRYPKTPVATTEPVGDYMLQAAGTVNETPFPLQADIMNGVDPGAAGGDLPGLAVLQAPGQGVRLQPAGHRLADRLVPRRRPRSTASPWSACTRRCRPPATTTSPGCSPRSTRWRRRWPTRSPRRSCERRSVTRRQGRGWRRADPRGRGGRRAPGRPRRAARCQLRDATRGSSPG